MACIPLPPCPLLTPVKAAVCPHPYTPALLTLPLTHTHTLSYNIVQHQDHPLAIGEGQTISAPHMHAICLELLEPHLQPGARVLDVGAGGCGLVGGLFVCGYVCCWQEKKGMCLCWAVCWWLR